MVAIKLVFWSLPSFHSMVAITCFLEFTGEPERGAPLCLSEMCSSRCLCGSFRDMICRNEDGFGICCGFFD